MLIAGINVSMLVADVRLDAGAMNTARMVGKATATTHAIKLAAGKQTMGMGALQQRAAPPTPGNSESRLLTCSTTLLVVFICG